MNFDGDFAGSPKEHIESGMMTINALSLPLRGVSVALNGLIKLIASTHPVARDAFIQISQVINDSLNNSTLVENWRATKIKILDHFHQNFHIEKADTTFFLDSVEELALAGGVASGAILAKTALKSATQFTSLIKARYTGQSILDNMLTSAKPFSEGLVDLYIVKGAQNSTLFYIDYIQRNRRFNWKVQSALSESCSPYNASISALAINEIGERAGTSQFFLQFHPVNPKVFKELAYSYPVFELSSAVESAAKNSFNILQVISAEFQQQQNGLYSTFVSAAQTQETPLFTIRESKNTLVDQDGEILTSIENQLIDMVGQCSGLNPTLNELQKLHETMVVLAKNPAQGLVKVISDNLKIPENMVKNVVNCPQDFINKGELLLSDPAVGCVGALAVCGTLLTFMNSVTWVIDFSRNPQNVALETFKMPYTIVKGVVELGIGLLRNPEKTAIAFCKSIIKAPLEIVNNFLRAIGLKKRKKKRRYPPAPSSQEQARLIKQYVVDLTTLYGNAKNSWFIDPFKTIENYHYELLKDWQMQPNVQLQCPNFYNFPIFLNTKFGEGNLIGVKALSPRAHPSETIAPLEVGFMYLQIETSMEKLQETSQALRMAHEINEKANEKLNEEHKRLEQIVPQLNSLLTPTNKDKIQQALLARINARNNQ